MGNIELVKKMIRGNNCKSTKKFDLEDLIKKDYLSPMFDKFSSETCQYHDKYETISNIYQDYNLCTNSNSYDNFKNNLTKEMNEIYTAGFRNAEYLEQELKDFGKNFSIQFPEGYYPGGYQREQYYKMFLLYCYIKPFYSEEVQAKDDFFKKLATHLESEGHSDQTDTMMQTFSMIFSMEAMRVFKTQSPEILEKALLHMHSTLVNVSTGLFLTLDYEFFDTTEEILNNQRDFLVELATDQSSPKLIRELSVKIILLIGNIRESGEDLLVVYNLIKEQNINVNLYNELNLIKTENVSDSQTDNAEFKVDTKNGKEVSILTGLGSDPNYYDY